MTCLPLGIQKLTVCCDDDDDNDGNTNNIHENGLEKAQKLLTHRSCDDGNRKANYVRCLMIHALHWELP